MEIMRDTGGNDERISRLKVQKCKSRKIRIRKQFGGFCLLFREAFKC